MRRYTIPLTAVVSTLVLAGWTWGGGVLVVAGQFWGSRFLP